VNWLQTLDALTLWRGVTVLVLGWLAYFFGRTLRPGAIPLIERIAAVSEPELTPSLRRYTRLLTAIWCGYFVVAAALLSIAAAQHPAGAGASAGAWVWAGTAALFVGEHWLRPWFFPGRVFPSLAQQIRDTWSVWHPGRR
jgi:uncharacterized membrane protein